MPDRLLVAFPLYKVLPTAVFSNWLAMDQANVVGTLSIETAYLPTSMDLIVGKALEYNEWDRLVVFEQDMLPGPDALARMAHYPPEADVVGSMYFQHEPPHNANVYIENLEHDGSYSCITPQTVKEWCDDPCLHQCGAVGFGFTGIARHVLENWDHENHKMFAIGEEGCGSHDLLFCNRARRQDYNIYVDSGVVCGHDSKFIVGIEENQRFAYMIEGEEILDFEYPGA